MTPILIASQFFKRIELHQWYEVERLLADDFLCYGPLPDPIDKSTWLDLIESLCIAFPDWTFDIKNLMAIAHDQVEATLHIKGTHKGMLDLSVLDLKPIPASGLQLSIPDEKATLTFDNNMIISLHAGEKIHNGLLEMLTDLEMD